MAYVPPSLILSLAMAAMYGALFHLLWGRTAIGLLRALGIAIVGFLVGQAGARIFGLHLLMMGDVHLGVASAFAWAGLGLDHWRPRSAKT